MTTERRHFRFYWHLLLGFFSRHWIIIVGLIILISLTGWLGVRFNLLQKRILRIGLVGQYETHNLPQQISRLISQGLVKINDDGSILPAAAKEWQIQNDDKEYIFSLRDDLVWDDNRPLSAEDINYSYQDLSVEVTDKLTITIKLKEKFSPLLTLLSRPIFKKDLIGLGGDYRVKKTYYQGNYINIISLEPKDKQQSLLK